MSEHTYFDQRNINNIKKIRTIQSELPGWFSEFLRSVETTTSALTRLNYSYDTRVFLNYLVSENITFADYDLKNITTNMLNTLTLNDLELYVEYLSYYITKDDIEHENSVRGKARTIASLRSLFKYLYNDDDVLNSPSISTSLITSFKINLAFSSL